MSKLQATASATVRAPAGLVYTIIADHVNHHPHILPKPYFARVEVEAGGYGAGTLLRTYMDVYGQEREFHMRVEEPEPGRIMTETDIDSGLVTTFTVTPRGESASEVTIATEWEGHPGIRGLVDRILTPLFLRRVYRQELQLLDQYAQDQAASKSP